MDTNPTSPDEKTAVLIYGLKPLDQDTVECILWGLEEEGIPAELIEVLSGSAEDLAKQAADRSPLNVGIGINGMEEVVVLQHRDLPKEKPLFSVGIDDSDLEQLRNIGVNAARLVKGEPLVNPIGNVNGTDAHKPIRLSQEQLEELIVKVLAETVIER